ncbi:MAG: hypothetical protein ACR2OU_17205 [Thermomicrobiales bacterium]
MKITFGATEVELPTGTFVLTYGIGMSKATSTLDLRVDISVQDFYTISVAGYHDGNFTD